MSWTWITQCQCGVCVGMVNSLMRARGLILNIDDIQVIWRSGFIDLYEDVMGIYCKPSKAIYY